MENNSQRETLGSRLGFILLSAGCAIGLGNVWKFPYMVGQYGGGLFVLIYIAFLVIIGVPIMTMEFSLGRASRKSVVHLYRPLEPQGSKWHVHGYFALGGNVILMMFYTVVAGWLLQYFAMSGVGAFNGMDASAVSGQFGEMLSNPGIQYLCAAIVVVLGFLVCSFGVKKSLEKITKVMMIALLAIMIVLAVRAFFLEGAAEGLYFYLVPNFETVAEVGIFNVISGALSQSFFTLSIGIGSMAIFGSYLNKERSLLGESIRIAALDTFVAITAGLIIFPVCFTYNDGNVGAGPSLIFQTLPNLFNNMPLGQLWGSLFFLFLAFAALSTVFAVFENIVACMMDMTNWSRPKTCIVCCAAMLILILPCIFGFNIWSGWAPFGGDSSILDLEDFMVSNILLPIGAFIFCLFCTLKKGWGWDNFVEEANQGKGAKIKKWMSVYMKYILPVIMFVFIFLSIITFFI